ncbi:Hypothetical protein BCAN_A1400 [Brucella canis ATCC 23365]|uniref:Uncharacterized protein n=1 Tax=Brucella canis (strain ATCC 23365 / NCTC 10854 / RM-666) TaxID=483179 RepID=A9M629_BRUC2|nr:Hypothetical protein BCAN_A1400 [Brucella canis ATCC 23365]
MDAAPTGAASTTFPRKVRSCVLLEMFKNCENGFHGKPFSILRSLRLMPAEFLDIHTKENRLQRTRRSLFRNRLCIGWLPPGRLIRHYPDNGLLLVFPRDLPITPLNKNRPPLRLGFNLVKQNADCIVLAHCIGLLAIGGERIERAATETKGHRHDYRAIINHITQPPHMLMLNHFTNIVVRHFRYQHSAFLLRHYSPT